MLHPTVAEEYSFSIALFNTSKEMWDCLDDMLQGDIRIHRSRLDLLKQDINLLLKDDGETMRRCSEG